MLAIIIGIAVIFILFKIGAAIAKALAKTAKVILCCVGGLFLLAVVLVIIREYGVTLLKVVGVILGVAAVIFVILGIANIIRGIYAKIKLNLDTQKYIQWLDSVGISENQSAPFDSEARNRAILEGAALSLNSTYTASIRFYQEVEREILQKQMFTISDFTVVAQARSIACLPTKGIVSMMKYLAKKNSLDLFDPTKPAMPTVPEYCCIQHNLSSALTKLAKKKGRMAQDDFKTAALEAEPVFCDAAWIPMSFLELLVSRGEMTKVPLNADNLYIIKGVENLETESTSTEISWDDDF